jgi:hypothetical protein
MRLPVLAALAALMHAGCGSTKTVVRTVTTAPPLGASADEMVYGRVISAEPAKGGYFVHFDPASWLSGITANVAFAQSMHQTCAPRACPPVPNDYYVVDDGHTRLTYFLPHTTSGTVLTRSLAFPGTVVSADRFVRPSRRARGAALRAARERCLIRIRNDTIIASRSNTAPGSVFRLWNFARVWHASDPALTRT